MTRLVVHAPSRLHFGLLSWGEAAPREFGGVGLMVDAPGLRIAGQPAAEWSATGPLAGRVLATAERVAAGLVGLGRAPVPLRFEVLGAPPEHVGLGVGTQLGMAVAWLVDRCAAGRRSTMPELGRLAGRGLRSGIGLHGFALGGLIVDGGRNRATESPPPLLSRLAFPAEWSVLVIIPPDRAGLHGEREVRAFRDLPPLPEATVDRLCRLVLLDLLPAVAEADLDAFGAALEEIQARVGAGFAAAQGGAFASPEVADLARFLQSIGLQGVGQSSWGPTLYGLHGGSSEEQADILRRIRDRIGLSSAACFWTQASLSGMWVEADGRRIVG